MHYPSRHGVATFSFLDDSACMCEGVGEAFLLFTLRCRALKRKNAAHPMICWMGQESRWEAIWLLLLRSQGVQVHQRQERSPRARMGDLAGNDGANRGTVNPHP